MKIDEVRQRIIKNLPDDFLKDDKNREALSIMGNALEKQIPKKPKLMEKPLINSKYWFYCPNCNASRHTDIKVNCCSYCGQALDWSDEE